MNKENENNLIFEKLLNNITFNMEEIINCAHCGKKLKAGDSYSSYEIQTEIGIGYGICEKCYNIEFSRKNQIKGE